MVVTLMNIILIVFDWLGAVQPLSVV